MDQQKIGTFLKQLRQERQLTQENLAEIMCVTNRSVSRWENGVNLPDLPHPHPACRFLRRGAA